MQYQVYKEDTGEMVAWIDPESIVQIVKNGYAIKCGENLKANESEDEENEKKSNQKNCSINCTGNPSVFCSYWLYRS